MTLQQDWIRADAGKTMQRGLVRRKELIAALRVERRSLVDTRLAVNAISPTAVTELDTALADFDAAIKAYAASL